MIQNEILWCVFIIWCCLPPPLTQASLCILTFLLHLHYKPSHTSSLLSSVVIINSNPAQPSTFTALRTSNVTHTYCVPLPSLLVFFLFPPVMETRKQIIHLSQEHNFFLNMKWEKHHQTFRVQPWHTLLALTQCLLTEISLFSYLYANKIDYALHLYVMIYRNWKRDDGWSSC